MSAAWHPDPLARAQLRYHDGTTWTHHIAINGQQSVEPAEYPLVPAQPGGGRLIAAAVMALISALVTAFISVVMFVVVSDPNAFNDCTNSGGTDCAPMVVANPGLVRTLAAFYAVLAVLLVVAGVGGCLRKYWGQICLIVVGALGVLLFLLPIALQGQVGGAIPVGWFALIAGLAATTPKTLFNRL